MKPTIKNIVKKMILAESESIDLTKPVVHKLVIKQGVDNIDDSKKELIKKFITFISKELELTQGCSVYLCGEKNDKLKTTASYNPGSDDIWVYTKNRNMLGDILRSIAHEFMHFKQKLNDELHEGSGDDGSEHENQANSFSGKAIRMFGKQHPEINI